MLSEFVTCMHGWAWEGSIIHHDEGYNELFLHMYDQKSLRKKYLI